MLLLAPCLITHGIDGKRAFTQIADTDHAVITQSIQGAP
jgi:hypothetical protein